MPAQEHVEHRFARHVREHASLAFSLHNPGWTFPGRDSGPGESVSSSSRSRSQLEFDGGGGGSTGARGMFANMPHVTQDDSMSGSYKNPTYGSKHELNSSYSTSS